MARGPKDLAGRRLQEFSQLEDIIDKVIDESSSQNISICVDDLPNYSEYKDEIQQAYLNAGWSQVIFYGWSDPTYLKLIM